MNPGENTTVHSSLWRASALASMRSLSVRQLIDARRVISSASGISDVGNSLKTASWHHLRLAARASITTCSLTRLAEICAGRTRIDRNQLSNLANCRLSELGFHAVIKG